MHFPSGSGMYTADEANATNSSGLKTPSSICSALISWSSSGAGGMITVTELINVYISSAGVRGFQVIIAVVQRSDWSTQESYGGVDGVLLEGKNTRYSTAGGICALTDTGRWRKAIKEQRVK